MTEEERKRFSHFFDESEAYLSEKIESVSFYQLSSSYIAQSLIFSL